MNHYNVSLLKSWIRIAAGVCLTLQGFFLIGSLFVIAELLGLLEEIVVENNLSTSLKK